MVELFAIVYTNKIQGKLCVTRIVGARIGNKLSCATSSLGCKTTTHWDSLIGSNWNVCVRRQYSSPFPFQESTHLVNTQYSQVDSTHFCSVSAYFLCTIFWKYSKFWVPFLENDPISPGQIESTKVSFDEYFLFCSHEYLLCWVLFILHSMSTVNVLSPEYFLYATRWQFETTLN